MIHSLELAIITIIKNYSIATNPSELIIHIEIKPVRYY